MKIHRRLDNLPTFKKTVLTIGSFDGVHAGHRKILQQLKSTARKQGIESLVITFHPHPRAVIYPKDKSLRLLNSIEEKAELIASMGIDHLVIVPFSVEFAQQSPDEYVEKFLIGLFKPQTIVIGYDHRFGLNRQGDINHLKAYQEKYDFELIEIKRLDIDEIGVSSSKIRAFLQKGNIKQANELLKSDYPIWGTVVKGQQIGSKIGYPTANLEVESTKLLPPDGVYAVKVEVAEDCYQGMLYIGKRPTIEDTAPRSIEVNIFDFDDSIYGDQIRLSCIEKIRDDQTFDSLEQLKKQLAKDKYKTLEVLGMLNPNQSFTEYPETAIVILNYNGKHFLEVFLPGILNHCPPFCRVVIADNASTDDSVSYVESHFPTVELLIFDKNYGFTGGYNRALDMVEASYFILLNSDIEIKSDWIEPLVEAMEQDPKIAACQPKILSQQNPSVFDYAGAAGGMMDYFDYPLCRGRVMFTIEEDKGQYEKASEIFWSTGAAMIIRAGLFKKFGGFQEEYFAHHEEIDLCWRMKNAGYKIMYFPESVVYHIGGGTLDYKSPRKTFLNFRNSFLTILKNERLDRLLWLFPLRLILDGIAGLRFIFKGEFKNVKAIVEAHFSMYGKFGFWLKQRKIAKSTALKHKIGAANLNGRIPQVLLLSYFLKGQQFFSDIIKK